MAAPAARLERVTWSCSCVAEISRSSVAWAVLCHAHAEDGPDDELLAGAETVQDALAGKIGDPVGDAWRRSAKKPTDRPPSRLPPTERACAICEGLFVPNRPWQRTCGPACRTAYRYREKNAARRRQRRARPDPERPSTGRDVPEQAHHEAEKPRSAPIPSSEPTPSENAPRTCDHCGQPLPSSAHANQRFCASCQRTRTNSRVKDWYLANRDQIVAKERERYARRKENASGA